MPKLEPAWFKPEGQAVYHREVFMLCTKEDRKRVLSGRYPAKADCLPFDREHAFDGVEFASSHPPNAKCCKKCLRLERGEA